MSSPEGLIKRNSIHHREVFKRFLNFHVNVFIFIQNRIMTWLRVSHGMTCPIIRPSFPSFLYGQVPLNCRIGFSPDFLLDGRTKEQTRGESSRAQKLTQCLDSFVICHLHHYGSPGNAVLSLAAFSPWLLGSPLLLMQSITKVFPLIVKHSSRISCLDKA